MHHELLATQTIAAHHAERFKDAQHACEEMKEERSQLQRAEVVVVNECSAAIKQRAEIETEFLQIKQEAIDTAEQLAQIHESRVEMKQTIKHLRQQEVSAAAQHTEAVESRAKMEKALEDFVLSSKTEFHEAERGWQTLYSRKLADAMRRMQSSDSCGDDVGGGRDRGCFNGAGCGDGSSASGGIYARSREGNARYRISEWPKHVLMRSASASPSKSRALGDSDVGPYLWCGSPRRMQQTITATPVHNDEVMRLQQHLSAVLMENEGLKLQLADASLSFTTDVGEQSEKQNQRYEDVWQENVELQVRLKQRGEELKRAEQQIRKLRCHIRELQDGRTDLEFPGRTGSTLLTFKACNKSCMDTRPGLFRPKSMEDPGLSVTDQELEDGELSPTLPPDTLENVPSCPKHFLVRRKSQKV
eukprot:gnl/MRDRNA2_/MRDRNA2_234844_c0_seq1.p1 gnl/MRDRNA2_/MRDRNA2_234844_c0~~gnl/MRDRNA2_/MRDRNA2_234844_c0_seq1.p1  ORF type:complete len:482 (+),score=128.68 gnl/MRDRNA2_/MRDRNA2_234844_c0_seq1:198-1448(+)